MLKFFHFCLLVIFTLQLACAQFPTDRPHASDASFDTKISQTIDFTVDLIGAEALQQQQDSMYIFDTRAKEEYAVSHIPGAQYLGYDDFDVKRLGDLPKDAPIVVYCSIGYRSEKIGERLQDLGYTNVHNLYGSLFDWVNR
ncbi:MAG: rhodanese-like domain-containing protein, partial [Bacteroidota bacterium]